MMNSIGGYFSLELQRNKSFLHNDGILLNTGRNALEYILRALGDVQLIYIPYYTCNVILEPLSKLGISYCFYHINICLEISSEINLKEGEYLLYTNYFGIKDRYVKDISLVYGNRLIVDNAQAFYTEPVDGVSTIYSPRKFVGIPDGGIAYCSEKYKIVEYDESYERCSHLLKRYDLGASGGYEDLHMNSAKLHDLPVRKMSRLTEAMMHSIDFGAIMQCRWQNFMFLHEALVDSNILTIPPVESFACPMVYPYYTQDTSLRVKLIEQKIFIAQYWPNVLEWCNDADEEFDLCTHIIPISVDQRYCEKDMERIIKIVKEYGK